MAILINDDRHMFAVFTKYSRTYLTVLTGGIAQYDITVELSKVEQTAISDDQNIAIALAIDVATRTSAYDQRLIRPSIDPS